MKLISKIWIGFVALGLLAEGCKAHRHTYDKDFLKYYESINDTIIGQEMAREMDRIENNKLRLKFQCNGITKKEGYNIITFQYMYDGGFDGGIIELYFNPIDTFTFKNGRAYFVDFQPESGGEPVGAPNR